MRSSPAASVIQNQIPETSLTVQDFQHYLSEQRQMAHHLYIQKKPLPDGIVSITDPEIVTDLKQTFLNAKKQEKNQFLQTNVQIGCIAMSNTAITEKCKNLIKSELSCYDYFDGGLPWGYVVHEYIKKILPQFQKKWPTIFYKIYQLWSPELKNLFINQKNTWSASSMHEKYLAEFHHLLPILEAAMKSNHNEAGYLCFLLNMGKSFIETTPTTTILNISDQEQYKAYLKFQHFIDIKLIEQLWSTPWTAHFPTELKDFHTDANRQFIRSLALETGKIESRMLGQLHTTTFHRYISKPQYYRNQISLPKNLQLAIVDDATRIMSSAAIARISMMAALDIFSKGKSYSIYAALGSNSLNFWNDFYIFSEISPEITKQIPLWEKSLEEKIGQPLFKSEPSTAILVRLLFKIHHGLLGFHREMLDNENLSNTDKTHILAISSRSKSEESFIPGFLALHEVLTTEKLTFTEMLGRLEAIKDRLLITINEVLPDFPAFVLEKHSEALIQTILEIFIASAKPILDYLQFRYVCQFFETGDLSYIISANAFLEARKEMIPIMNFISLEGLKKLIISNVADKNKNELKDNPPPSAMIKEFASCIKKYTQKKDNENYPITIINSNAEYSQDAILNSLKARLNELTYASEISENLLKRENVRIVLLSSKNDTPSEEEKRHVQISAPMLVINTCRKLGIKSLTCNGIDLPIPPETPLSVSSKKKKTAPKKNKALSSSNYAKTTHALNMTAESAQEKSTSESKTQPQTISTPNKTVETSQEKSTSESKTQPQTISAANKTVETSQEKSISENKTPPQTISAPNKTVETSQEKSTPIMPITESSATLFSSATLNQPKTTKNNNLALHKESTDSGSPEPTSRGNLQLRRFLVKLLTKAQFWVERNGPHTTYRDMFGNQVSLPHSKTVSIGVGKNVEKAVMQSTAMQETAVTDSSKRFGKK